MSNLDAFCKALQRATTELRNKALLLGCFLLPQDLVLLNVNNDNSLTAGHSSSSSVNLSLRNNFQTHTLRGEGMVREDSL